MPRIPLAADMRRWAIESQTRCRTEVAGVLEVRSYLAAWESPISVGINRLIGMSAGTESLKGLGILGHRDPKAFP